MVATWVHRSVLAGAVAALVPCISPRAEAHGDELLAAVALAAVAPSDVGVAFRSGATPAAQAALCWSWQLALGHDAFEAANPHRIVAGFDLLPLPGSAALRGRFGYRFAWRDLLAGLGPAMDARGVSLSPELGFRFAGGDGELEPSLHVLARAAVTPDGVRGATFLVGWSLL